MPLVKFDRIVSCSSEDPSHPSKNLLLGRDYNRKWKCQEPGEKSASVIIQLKEPYHITGIDIGNESSSFVEVLVSRTSSPDDFKVLLVMSSLMTPMDAKAETNRNRVRMFDYDSLSEPEKKEKWDRIKVVCTQPFNKHLQYGLSFIVLHSSESKEESLVRPKSPVKTLGRFTLKDEEESDFSAGSFFSRRKDLQASPPPVALTGAAAVRDASSPANIAQQKAAKKRKGSDDMSDSQKKKKGKPKKDDPDTPNDKGSNDLTDSQKKKKGRPEKDDSDSPNDKEVKPKQSKNRIVSEEKPKKNSLDPDDSNESSPKIKVDKKKPPFNNDQPKHRALVDVASTSSTQHSQKPSSDNRSHITYKPFNKLLEGVEIVISGYQNPGRANIRDRALEMGAKYSGDWRSSSTHLICAFTNTPKLQQLQSQGVSAIVVGRDWVDDCYRERKKLSWRSYALLDKDKTKGTSEPEVWEFIPGMVVSQDSPVPPVSRRNDIAKQDTRLKSDSEDSEDEIERIKAKQSMRKKIHEESKKDLSTSTKNKKSSRSDSSDSEDDVIRVKDKLNSKKEVPNDVSSKHSVNNKAKPSDDAYNCSTDADSEEEARNRLAEWSKTQRNASVLKDLPPLADFFKEKTFFLSPDLSREETQSLSRYIIAFGGDILESADKSTHFVISNKKFQLPEGTRSACVTPEWVWECNDRQRLVSPILFELI